MSDIIRVGTVLLGDGVPKICTCVSGKNSEELMHNYKSELYKGKNPEGYDMDLIEIRMDSFQEIKNHTAVINVLRMCKDYSDAHPLLFTVRSEEEGGQASISEDEYMKLLAEVAKSHVVDAIDVEVIRLGKRAKQIISVIKECSIPVIASYHDMKGTADNLKLLEYMQNMAESGADVIKIAVTPKNEQDVLRLYEVEYQYKKQERKPFITIAMGDVGKVTRISGLFTGSCMTFGYIGRPSATGQISAKVLAQLRKDLTEERNNGKKV